MNKRLIKVLTGILGVLLLVIPSISVLAAESTSPMAYSVKANIPDNQIDKKLTYFDLLVTPGSTQKLPITFSNADKVDMTIDVTPNVAVTNNNGVIDYSKSKQKADKSLKNNFSELVKGPRKVTLKPGENKTIDYTIDIPKEKFDGIMLGGFLIQKEGQATKNKNKQGVQILNKYSYVIGTKLSETENPTVTPKLKLNDVKAGLVNYHTAVLANFQNTEPTIVHGLSVDAKVYQEGSNKVLHSTKKDGMAMAPNSNFDFGIDWGNQRIQPGKYRLKATAKDNDGHEWKFDKAFEISGADAAKVNDKAIEIPKDYTMYYIIGAIVIIVLAIIIYLYLRHRKQKASEAK